MKKLITAVSLMLVFGTVLCSCNFIPENSHDTQPTNGSADEDTDTTPDTSSESGIQTGSTESIEAAEESEDTQGSESESETAKKTETQKPNTDSLPSYYKTRNYDDMKAMWLSQFDLYDIYTANGGQRSEADVRKALGVAFDNISSYGFNTVIIQLRPYADSFYPSKYYPPSSYAAGAYGKEFSYDPFAITVELAKARGLSVHGWINPLRGMTEAQIQKVSDKYAVKAWYNDGNLRGKYIVKHSDNRWYLNPAYPAVRQLIINGAEEALAAYELDGLHMDDYFYPTADASFDASAYADYKADGGEGDVASFRRFCLNMLVKGIYSAVKKENPNALFGISPAGNWTDVYNKQCADYKTWCSVKGFIDYICPQVYFGLEHQSFDFKTVCRTWQDFITLEDVKLIVGMTFGKAESTEDPYAGSGKNEWKENKDVLKRCLEFTEELPRCQGVAVFCYQYFNVPLSGAENSATKQERENFLPVLKTISWK